MRKDTPRFSFHQSTTFENSSWHLFRHTYAATRLKTLDHGAPVSIWMVKEELGHGSIVLLEKTYGHLLERRAGVRLDRVEYRPVEVTNVQARTA